MANWAPPHKFKTFSMTSILRSPWRWNWSMLRSATRIWVVTRARVSRQIVAAARSRGHLCFARFPLVGTQPGGRRRGQECDGTGTGARSRGVGAAHGEGAAGRTSEGAAGRTSVWGKWCWDPWATEGPCSWTASDHTSPLASCSQLGRSHPCCRSCAAQLTAAGTDGVASSGWLNWCWMAG